MANEDVKFNGQAEAPDILNRYIEGTETPQPQVKSGGVALTPEQEKAREEGYSQSSLGVVRPTGGFSMPKRAIRTSSDGTANATAPTITSESDDDTADLDSSSLHNSLLGSTKYAELKRAVGIPVDGSFTDWYSGGGYVPAGYEKEARMLLAEERRMGLYEKRVAGELSETDFLYQAYGKDLLERDGIYLDSSLWWYQRHKSGRYDNPLDSDSFLSSLIENSRSLWQDESWFKRTSEAAVGDTFAGYVTGKWLSNDQFYEAFRTQVDALKPYFNDDVAKILTYYKAGNLGSAFSPFIDVDRDGKYDYYFHTDGRMYAVEDSSGVGSSKCTITYNDDNSVHAVQIRDGFDGPVDSFLEGVRDFFVGFLDIGSFVVSAVSGIFDAANGGTYFVDSQARWEAFKKSTWALGDKDYVTFDGGNPFNGEWTADDWANNIASGIGTVAGMVILAMTTAGIGNAVQGGAQAASAGTAAAQNALKTIGSNATEETIRQATATAFGQLNQELSGKALTQAMAGFQRELTASLVRSGVSKSLVKAATKEFTKGVALSTAKTEVAKAFLRLTQAGQKARSGFVVTMKGAGGSVWGQSMQIAATSAVKDFIQVYSSLESKNVALRFMEDQTGGQVKSLTQEDMLGRAFRVALADVAISGTLRATGNIGLTSRINALRGGATDAARQIYSQVNQQTKNVLTGFSNHMVRDMWVDNAADIIENISTMAIQAAESNPYAQTAEQRWNTAIETAFSPSSILTNMYIGFRNTVSFGNGLNMADQRMQDTIRAFNLDESKIRNAIPNVIRKMSADDGGDPNTLEAVRLLRIAQSEIESTLDAKAEPAKHLENVIAATKRLDELFSESSDDSLIAALGTDKETLDMTKRAMAQLNATGEVAGLFTSNVFLDAKRANVDSVLSFYEEAINAAHERAGQITAKYENFWKGFGRIPGLRRAAMATLANDMKQFLSSIAKSNYADAIKNADSDYMREFVVNRLHTLSEDPDGMNDLVKFFEDDTNGMKFSSLTLESCMPNAKVKVMRQSDGTVKLAYVSTDGKELTDSEVKALKEANPLLELFADYDKNRKAIERLSDVFKQIGDSNIYDIVTGNVPWFAIYMDKAKRNQILSDPNARKLVNALDTVAMLFEDGSGFDGFPLADYDVDLLVKVDVPYTNSDGTETARTIYVIPNRKDSTNVETINRLHVVQSFVYGIAKIQTMLDSDNPDPEAYLKELTKLGVLLSQDATFNGQEDFERQWKDAKQRDALTREFMEKAVTALLLKAQFDGKSEEGTIGRKQLISLYRKGILSDRLLTDIKAGGKTNDKVRDNIDMLRSYIDMQDRIQGLDTVAYFVANGKRKLTLDEYRRMESLSRDLNSDRFSRLRMALEQDGVIGKRIRPIIDNPAEYLNFVLGLSAKSALRLTREGSSGAETRLNDDDALRELLVGLAVQGIGERKKIESNFDLAFKVPKPAKGGKLKPEERNGIIQNNLIRKFGWNSATDFVNDFNSRSGSPDFKLLDSMLMATEGSLDGITMVTSAYKPTSGQQASPTAEGDEIETTDHIYINFADGKTKSLVDYVDGFRRSEFFEADDKFAETFVDGLFERARKYDEFLNANTVVTEAENVVTLDLYEIVPQAMRSAVIALQESEQARTQLSRFSQLKENELNLLKNRLLRSGATTSQLVSWNRLMSEFSGSDGLLRFDLGDVHSMRRFREIMESLGYGNDVEKILAGQESIEGVNLYDRERHSVVVRNGSSIRDVLISFGNAAMAKTKRNKDYGQILRNALACAQYMYDDTKITVPVAFGRSRSLDGAELFSDDGMTFLERNTKANLEASEGAKTTRIGYNSMGLNGAIDERSANTFSLARAVYSIFDYAKETTEYQSPMAIGYTDDLWKAVSSFYSSHKDSIIEANVIGDAKSGRTIVFSFKRIPDKDVSDMADRFLYHATRDGFDIRELIPLWDKTGDLKTRDFSMDRTASADTLVSHLLHQGIPGFSSTGELAELSGNVVRADSYYEYGDPEFSKLTSDIKTFGELRKLVDGKEFSDLATHSYEANIISYQVKAMELMNERISSELSPSLVKFADRKSQRIVSDLLAMDAFRPILDGNADSKTVSEFVEAFNSRYNDTDRYDQAMSFSDSIAYYQDDFTSAGTWKFDPRNSITIDSDDVRELASVLRSFDNGWVSDGLRGVPQHSALRSSLSFVRFDANGNMSISMEDYINASKSDRKKFSDFVLNELIGNAEGLHLDGATVKDLKDMLSILSIKDAEIESMGADRGIAEDRTTAVRYEMATESPSIEVSSKMAFFTGNGRLAKEEIGLLSEMAANRDFSRKAQDKFIRSSSMELGKFYPDTEGSFMASLLKGTSYLANDKSGSTMVYNLRSYEGAGEFIMQMRSFADAVQKSMSDSKVENLPDSAKLRKALLAVGAQLSLYTTGATFASEYAGALVLEYDTNTDDFTIKPINLSSTSPEENLYCDLLYDTGNGTDLASIQRAAQNGKRTFLFRAEKNAFVNNVSGYATDFSVFDMDDKRVKQAVLEDAYARAYFGLMGIRDGNMSDFKGPEDVLNSYYGQKVRMHDIRTNLIHVCGKFGISDETISNILPTVENMSVTQITKFREQKLNDFAKSFILELRDKVPNNQISALEDALLFGVTYSSIGVDGRISLDNLETSIRNDKIDSLRDIDSVNAGARIADLDEIVNQLRDRDTFDSAKVALSKLDRDDMAYVIKMYMLGRRRGKDLAAILSSKDVALSDYLKKVADTVDDDSLPWDTDKVANPKGFKFDELKDHKVAWFDTEWFYKPDSDDRSLYQFAFIVTDGKAKRKFNVLVADAISSKTDDDGWQYEEAFKTFSNKVDIIRKAKGKASFNEGDVNYVIVKNAKEAVDFFANTIKDDGVVARVAYNNKADNSDDSWIASSEEATEALKGIANLDLREDGLTKAYIKETDSLNTESLDSLREIGLLKTKGTEHDALSDCEDLIDLYGVLGSRTETTRYYTSLKTDISDMTGLREADLEDLLSRISFGKLRMDDDLKKALSGIDSLKKGNTVVKQILDAVTTSYEYNSKREENKALRKSMAEILHPIFGAEEREGLVRAAKSEYSRREFSSLFMAVYLANGGNPNDVSLDNGLSLQRTMDSFTKAFSIYKEDLNQDYEVLSNQRAYEKFLTLSAKAIASYLEKADPNLKGRTSLPEGSKISFTKEQYSKIPQLINMMDSYENEVKTNFYNRILNPVADIFYGEKDPNEGYSRKPTGDLNLFGADGVIGDSLRDHLFHAMTHVYGADSDVVSSLKGRTKNERLSRKNLITDGFSEDVIDFLQNDLFKKTLSSHLAAWKMAQEKREFVRDQGEFGTLYIGRDVLSKMDGFRINQRTGQAWAPNEGFYSMMWRQPGQQSTVMHVMKVIVTDTPGEFSMTRATAKTYFNGDFDGDFFYLTPPDDDSNAFGKSLFNSITAGGSMLDGIFENRNIPSPKHSFGEYALLQEKAKNVFRSLDFKQCEAILNGDRDAIAQFNDAISSSLGDTPEHMEAAKAFHIKQHEYTFGENALTSCMPFLKEFLNDPNRGALASALVKGNQDFVRFNTLDDNYIDQIFGIMSKHVRGKLIKSKDITDLTYVSTLAVPEESRLLLTEVFNRIGTTAKKEIADAMMENINGLHLTQDELSAIRNAIDSAFALGNKGHGDEIADRIITIAKTVQILELSSDGYRENVGKVYSGILTDRTKSLASKVEGALEMLRKVGYQVGTLTDEDKASGPRLLMRMSEAFEKVNDNRKIRNALTFSDKDGSVASRLFSDFLTKADVERRSKNGLTVIASESRGQAALSDKATKFKGVGLTGDVYIAVEDNDESTDTAYMLSGAKDIRVGTLYNEPIDFRKLPLSKRKEILSMLSNRSSTGTMSGWELSVMLNKEYSEVSNSKFSAVLIDAAGNRFDPTRMKASKWLDRNCRLVIYEMSNLYDCGMSKVGLRGTKNMKVTLSRDTNLRIPSEYNPIMVVSKKKLNYSKQNSSSSTFEYVGSPIEVDGKHYSIVKVNNMALLSILDQNDSYTSIRDMDPISILCGAQGVDAVLSYGDLFFSFDGNEFTFDPEGYRALNETISEPSSNRIEDANGTDIVRITRIATYFSVLPQEAQQRLLTFAGRCLGYSVNSPQAMLEEIAKRGDAGGSFGQNIEAQARRLVRVYDSESKLEEVLSDRKNVLQRTMFSDEVEDILYEATETRAEDDGEPIPGKKDKNRANRRVTSMHKELNEVDSLARAENANIDANGTFFIPRKALLRIALDMAKKDDDDIGLIVTTLKEGLSTGLIDPEEIKSGGRSNSYNPILASQAISVAGDSDDRAKRQDKKSGADMAISDSNRLTETGNELGLPHASRMPEGRLVTDHGLDWAESFSPYVRAGADYDSDIRGDKWNRYNRYKYGNLSNTRIMAMLSDGSDEQIYDALTGYRSVFSIDRTTPYATLSDVSDNLAITPRLHGATTVSTAQKAKQYIAENARSPKVERLRQKKLADLSVSLSIDKLRNEDPDVRLDLLSDRITSSVYAKANEEIMSAISEFKSEPTMTRITEDGILYRESESLDADHALKLVSLCADDNGLEFVNSALRSWGWKSKDNADIPLGSQVIRMNAVAGRYADELFGRDLPLLTFVGKSNPDQLLLLDECMRTQYVLDYYDDLVSAKATHIRNLGENGYKDAINECVQALGGDVEAMRNQLDSKIKSNVVLKTMFEASRNITARVMEEVKKQNPYAIVGWYITPPTHERKPMLAKTGSYMNVYRYSRDPSVTSMLENGFGERPKFASALYNESTGFIGNIIRVVNDLSKKKALNDLGSYMRSNGYMSNSVLFGIGNEVADKEIMSDFVSTFSDLYSEGDRNRASYNFQNDAYAYGVLQYTAMSAGINAKPNYESPADFVELSSQLFNAWNKALTASGATSFGEYVSKWQSSVGDDKDQYEIGISLYNAYMNTISTMASMMSEAKGKPANGFLLSVYNRAVEEMAKRGDFVFVDRNGAMLLPKEKDRIVPTYSQYDIDDIVKAYRFGGNMSDDEKRIEVAKMILSGDAFMMRRSLAEQLDRKLFTTKQHGMVHSIIKKSRSILTSLIMSNPLQLMDRLVNFPLFDLGVDAGADYRTLAETPEAIATINKLVALGDRITEEDIAADENLQLLVRFITASNQDLRSSSSVRGENVGTTNIPLIKQYIKLANLGYNIGNSIPRFAYFMNMVKNAQETGNGIDPTRMGVAFHMQKGISGITGRAYDEVYSRYGDKAQAYADLDAQAVQIIAEHNGFEGNMPYIAKYLNENYNTMFLSFPMALVRWGKNRVQSLGYAFATMAESSASRKYLLNQTGSVLLTQAILLGLQMMLSSATRSWLEKKATGKDDEVTEEESKAAEDILFRGGCVRIFDTLGQGQEVTTTGHNRGPISALFDSYLSDFVPSVSNGAEGKKVDFSTFWYAIMKHTWGHAPFLVKDVVESVPGNRILQSTSWAEPSDNFLENYARKVTGYALGSQQATAMMDYYRSAGESSDDGFMQKLNNGMRYAYSTKFANTKESKSNWKNYRKAFSIVYDYKQKLKTTDSSDYENANKASFASLKSQFLSAIKTQNNIDSLMYIIQKAKSQGTSLSTIRSALKSCSIKQQLLSLPDYREFMASLPETDKSIIKQAMIYEDKSLPFIDDAWNDLTEQYEASRKTSYSNPSISSIMYDRNRNMPTSYQSGRTSNSNYGLLRNTFGNGVYKNGKNDPIGSYDSVINKWKYGKATDIYGNTYSRYTNASGDKWEYGG